MSLLIKDEQLKISDEQARKYARCIYYDIAQFISDNQEEFQEWLKTKQQKQKLKEN